MRYNSIAQKPNRKGLAAIYRQEIIRDITLFTSQGAASFYDKLFASLDFELPRAKTGRTGFPKEAMLCAGIVMKCEGFGYITDLRDFLDNNRLIARILKFSDFKAKYVLYLKELVEARNALMDRRSAQARIRAWQERIAPYIDNDTGEDTVIEDKPASWGNHSEYNLLETGSDNFFNAKAASINALP